jgi:hypothetical protein
MFIGDSRITPSFIGSDESCNIPEDKSGVEHDEQNVIQVSNLKILDQFLILE